MDVFFQGLPKELYLESLLVLVLSSSKDFLKSWQWECWNGIVDHKASYFSNTMPSKKNWINKKFRVVGQHFFGLPIHKISLPTLISWHLVQRVTFDDVHFAMYTTLKVKGVCGNFYTNTSNCCDVIV